MNFRKSKPYEAALGSQNDSLLSLKPFLFVYPKAPGVTKNVPHAAQGRRNATTNCPGSEGLVLQGSEVWVLVMMLLERGSEKDWCSAHSGLKPTSANRVLMDCSHARSFAYPSVTSFRALLK